MPLFESKIFNGTEVDNSHVHYKKSLFQAIADLRNEHGGHFCSAILVTENELYSSASCLADYTNKCKKVSVYINGVQYDIDEIKYTRFSFFDVSLIIVSY